MYLGTMHIFYSKSLTCLKNQLALLTIKWVPEKLHRTRHCYSYTMKRKNTYQYTCKYILRGANCQEIIYSDFLYNVIHMYTDLCQNLILLFLSISIVACSLICLCKLYPLKDLIHKSGIQRVPSASLISKNSRLWLLV